MEEQQGKNEPDSSQTGPRCVDRIWGAGEERIPPAQRPRDNCLAFDFIPPVPPCPIFCPAPIPCNSHTNLKAAVSSAAPPPVVIPPASSLFACSGSFRVCRFLATAVTRRAHCICRGLPAFDLRPSNFGKQALCCPHLPYTGLVSLCLPWYYTSLCVINPPSACSPPFSREAAKEAWRTPYCLSLPLHPRPDSCVLCCAVLCCGGRCASHRLIRPATLHLEPQVGLTTTTTRTLSKPGLEPSPSFTFSLTSNIASISTWPSRETPARLAPPARRSRWRLSWLAASATSPPWPPPPNGTTPSGSPSRGS